MNIYLLHQKIHTELERLKVEVENEGWYYHPENKRLFQYLFWGDGYEIITIEGKQVDLQTCTPAIQALQIRQILVALQEVLENKQKENSAKWQKEYTEHTLKNFIPITPDNSESINKRDQAFFATHQKDILDTAEALYQKWCYGFPQSQFETNPEQVLTELLEVLKTI